MCVCKEADGIRLQLHYYMENTVDADIPPIHNKTVFEIVESRILCGCVSGLPDTLVYILYHVFCCTSL